MSYSIFLFDADMTLLDFKRAEHHALQETFSQWNIPLHPELMEDFQRINQGMWRALEQGEVSREELQDRRFTLLFQKHRIDSPGRAFNDDYLGRLSKRGDLLPQAMEVLRILSQKKRLFLATNGIAHVQRSRLDAAGLTPFFEELFISEEIGYPKPHPAFFEFVLQRLYPAHQEEMLMVGDSLITDIAGAHQARIDSCLFDPADEHPEAPSTWRIRHLEELLLL